MLIVGLFDGAVIVGS